MSKKKKAEKATEESMVAEDEVVVKDVPVELEPKPKPKNQLSSDTLTMEGFLATSSEIKKKFNSYVRIGFAKKINMARINDPSQPYRRTYEDWMRLITEYAET